MSLTRSLFTKLAWFIASLDIAAALAPVTSEKEPRAVEFTFKQRSTPTSLEHVRLKKRERTQDVAVWGHSVEYLVNVTVGSPPQNVSVVIDTGSSDFWIPSAFSDLCTSQPQICKESGSYKSNESTSYRLVEPDAFYVSYGDLSEADGDWANETIGIGSMEIQNQQIGIARSITGFEGSTNVTGGQPGIMGLNLAAGESVNAENETYPTLLQSLKTSGAIRATAYSLWLNSHDDELSGSLLFGGVDTGKYSGSLKTTPIRALNSTRKDRLAVELTSIVVEDKIQSQHNVLHQKIIVLLDSGASGACLPNTTAFEIYKLCGAVYDQSNGPMIPCTANASATNLTFSFGNQTGPSITTPLKNFVSPLYSRTNTSTLASLDSFGPTCSFGIRPLNSLTSVPYLGIPFLQSAYTVFDLENDQISLAQVVPNPTDTNIVEISSDDGHNCTCGKS